MVFVQSFYESIIISSATIRLKGCTCPYFGRKENIYFEYRRFCSILVEEMVVPVIHCALMEFKKRQNHSYVIKDWSLTTITCCITVINYRWNYSDGRFIIFDPFNYILNDFGRSPYVIIIDILSTLFVWFQFS